MKGNIIYPHFKKMKGRAKRKRIAKARRIMQRDSRRKNRA